MRSIKNHWNTHLKKRLITMGINPTTHKPLNDAVNLSHMAQLETARPEAEARHVKEYSKLRLQNQLGSSSSSQPSLTRSACPQQTHNSPAAAPAAVHVSSSYITPPKYAMMLATDDLESPVSTLTFLDNVPSNSKCANSETTFGLINQSSLPSSSTTVTVTSDGEPWENKERSFGEDDDIMAAVEAFSSIGYSCNSKI